MLSQSAGTLNAQQVPVPPPQTFQLSFAELDQLAAPVALYPDALVAQVLAAATYAPQIDEAEAFVELNGDLPPQELARLVDTQPWDPGVKALTAFPSVLSNLDRNMQWTTRLGDAYYNQPQDVMNAIQEMRQRAYDAGTLRSSSELSVGYQPVNPAVVYVPVYNPWAVYGAPVPVYPTYAVVQGPPADGVAVAAAIGFTAGSAVAAFSSYGWGCAHWAPNWVNHTVVYDHAPYVSHSVTVVNHGYYGGFDHSSAAVAYNHQAFNGPNGISSRTVARTDGQTNVHATGLYGNSMSRSTSYHLGGSSTTAASPNGQSATHAATGRGTGNVTAISTGPNGGSATRASSYSAGGSSTTVAGPKGQAETTSVSGHGTGHATVTRSGARGNGARTVHIR
ncbi:DUF3300 domain-containing protein [Granulicella sp. S156]|uniref:DUF3300 domain-containing protein n=1 Tax=Granulicella sp. S156 TaxID=1747224 RepID=UPI00131D456C|nr:DUF3300 domain-containing protein [Granulicella sp. S156]